MVFSVNKKDFTQAGKYRKNANYGKKEIESNNLNIKNIFDVNNKDNAVDYDISSDALDDNNVDGNNFTKLITGYKEQASVLSRNNEKKLYISILNDDLDQFVELLTKERDAVLGVILNGYILQYCLVAVNANRILGYLLSNGVIDVNEFNIDNQQESELSLFRECPLLSWACISLNVGAVELIVKHCPRMVNMTGGKELLYTPLHYCMTSFVFSEDKLELDAVHRIVSILFKNGIDPEALDCFNRTPYDILDVGCKDLMERIRDIENREVNHFYKERLVNYNDKLEFLLSVKDFFIDIMDGDKDNFF